MHCAKDEKHVSFLDWSFIAKIHLDYCTLLPFLHYAHNPLRLRYSVVTAEGSKMAGTLSQQEVFLKQGRDALLIEAETLAALVATLDSSFVELGNAILRCDGKIILMGIGKSGLIAAKIAATLSSTGTPAFLCTPMMQCTATSYDLE